MSQASVLEYLEKCNEPKTQKEITKAIGVKSQTSLLRLRRHREICFKLNKKNGAKEYLYWIKEEESEIE